MLPDMVNEDIAYIPRYAHIRGNNRKNAFDTFGHLAVYIDMGTVGRRSVYQILVSIATRFIFLFSRFYKWRFLRLYLNLSGSWGRFRIFDGYGFLSGLFRILVHGLLPAEDRNIPDNDILEDILIHFHFFLCHGCTSLSLTISSSASSARPLPSSCLAGGGSRVQRKKARLEWVISFS